MGATQSNGKKSLDSRLNTAAKTGVLNLEDNKELTTRIWARILSYTPDFPTRIRILTLSDSDLKVFPAEVYQFTNIRKLYVSKCSLQRFQSLAPFSRLTHAIFDNNDLEESSISPFPQSLTHLNLSYNHISSFPVTLANLELLIELDLSANRLQVTTGIGLLINLQELKLDDNEINDVDEDIGHASKLKYVSLKRNILSASSPSRDGPSLPECMFTRTSLDHLDLEGNNVTKAEVLKFPGIEVFLERQQTNRLKNFSSGALVDYSGFGLD